MSNLPTTFSRDQRLSLEGDFDQHFALYCPTGYERDALYLFTPDVMARFIDNAAALDVEIVDDRLFLYARRELSTLDPAVWQWIFGTVDAIDEKLGQWARWRDERLPAARRPVASGVPLLTPPPVGSLARAGACAAASRGSAACSPCWRSVVAFHRHLRHVPALTRTRA